MTRAQSTSVCFLLVIALSLLAVGKAGAGDNDAVVRDLIAGIFDSEYANKKFREALEKLEVAKVVCEGEACSKTVQAELWMAIGTVRARLNDPAKAQQVFITALKLDPSVKLIDKHATPEVKAAFANAQNKISGKKPSRCSGDDSAGRKPRGYKSLGAFRCYRQAKEANEEEEWRTCITNARASLELEDRPATRLLLAECLQESDNLIEAIAELEELARQSARERRFRMSRKAKSKAARLRRRLPVLIIEVPADVDDLVVKLDGSTLPDDLLDQEMPVNPGPHTIAAEGKREGLPLRFEQEVLLEVSKRLTVEVRLAAGPPKWATRRELKCMLEAQSPDDFAKCLNKRTSSTADLTVRLGVELSGYSDTMDVHVLAPAVRAGVEHSSDGWGIGAAMLVDVVSAASVDILSTASPRWQEMRWVPSLKAHKRFDVVDLSVAGSLSHEPDYLAASVGGSIAAELRQKTVNPSLAYQWGHDVNGRVGTPFEAFSKVIDRHVINLGLGLVLTKATFGSLGMTMVFEDGDTSKPYRYVPMFDPSVAAQIPAGLKIDAVNFFRSPERPLEQLPTSRKRFAVTASLAHRFSGSTLRASERLYTDTWGVAASTTDARLMVDVAKPVRLWPHLRFHGQGAADFYELAYVAEQTADGKVRVPSVRTGDRELGPLIALTFGAGMRYDFGKRRSWGVTLSGDVVYTKFLNHLFAKDRFGYFGALGLEAELE